MYKISDTYNKNEMLKKPPAGPGFSMKKAIEAAWMEVWGSSFGEMEDDFCEFRLFDVEGVIIDRKKVYGY